MKTRKYLSLKMKTLNLFLFCCIISFKVFGQEPCDASSCIDVDLEELISGTWTVVDAYDNIGDTTLFCGYQSNQLGIRTTLQGISPPDLIWSFDDMSGDDFFLINLSDISQNGADTILVEADFNLDNNPPGSCKCIVILNEPDIPEANDITIPLCGDGTAVDYDLNNIPQTSITSSANVSITYHTDSLNAAMNANAQVSQTVFSGTIMYARVEDSNNIDCYSIATITFAVGQNPTANPDSNIQTIDCNNSQATINANTSGGTPPYTYSWTKDGTMVGGNTGFISATAMGTYTVVVTDMLGCSTTAEEMISEDFTAPTIGTISIPNGNEITCDIAQVELIANATSPNGGMLLYFWTTSNGTIISPPDQASINVNAGGTYTLTVTQESTGCEVSDDIFINQEDDTPEINIANDSPPELTLTCSITEITLNASASTTTGTPNFMWTTINGNIVEGADTSTPIVNQVGTYTLLLTDNDNNCSKSESVEVIMNTVAPTATIATPDVITCNQTTISLDASESMGQGTLSYNWGSGSTTNPTLTGVDVAQSYTVTVTDGANGCTDEAMVTVIQDTDPPSASPATLVSCDISGSGDFNLSDADSIVIGMQPDVTVTYHTSQNAANSGSNPITQDPYTSPETTIFARVEREDNGCHEVSEIMLDLQTLVPPTTTILPSSDMGMSFCGSDSSIVTVSIDNVLSGYDYRWSLNGSNDGVKNRETCAAIRLTNSTNSVSLIYELGGCQNTLSQTINLNNSDATDAKVFQFANTDILFCNRNDFDSYQWGRESINTLCPEPDTMGIGIFQDYVVPDGLNTTDYYYWVIVEKDGCTNKIYLEGNSPFGKLVQDPNIEYGDIAMQINPNPNNGAFELTITGDETRALDVHVYDALGRMVHHQDAFKEYGIQTYYVAVPNPTQGMYFVRVTGNDGILLTEKIIVK